jgi:NAD(P)-dependent dehydrogenase (short-subunit alcohol dehydrogenase family)
MTMHESTAQRARKRPGPTAVTNRRVLVTGGSKGIGRAVAGALATRGWSVTLLARDQNALELACAELPGEGHETLKLDVADEGGWERLASDLGDVQGLVCAAAIIDPVGPLGSYSVSEFRRSLEVNVLGTLLAIKTCLPALRASRGAVVTFSGGGATTPLPRFDAYSASKAAIARLTENLADDLAVGGVRINCVAPGFVATDIHNSTLTAGPELVGADYYERTLRELEKGGVPVSEAAELVCMLLEDDANPPVTGKLISAQWDPWRDVTFRRKLAQQRDVATLRRIDDMLFTSVSKDSA